MESSNLWYSEPAAKSKHSSKQNVNDYIQYLLKNESLSKTDFRNFTKMGGRKDLI